MSRGWKVFIGIAISMTVLLLGGVGFLVVTFASATNNGNVLHGTQVTNISTGTNVAAVPEKLKQQDFKPQDVIASPTGKMYVLVLGIDTRGNDLSGRTDSMTVVAVDKTNNSMQIISIPRDSYVELVGRGKYDKINHAYAYGGIEMAQATVENLLGIKIDHYVIFNFSSFMSFIDSLGGLDIDVPFSFSEQDSKGTHNAERFEKGLHTLNGEQALAYARMRHQDPRGDLGRGDRQRQVMQAVLDKLISLSSVPKYTELFNSMKGSIGTDVNVLDIAGLSGYLTHYGTTGSHQLNGKDMMLNGVYYFKLDQASIDEMRGYLQ